MCIFDKMDKLEYHSVIKFFVFDGFSQAEIHVNLVRVYKEFAPSLSAPKKRRRKNEQLSLNSHTSIEDNPC